MLYIVTHIHGQRSPPIHTIRKNPVMFILPIYGRHETLNHVITYILLTHLHLPWYTCHQGHQGTQPILTCCMYTTCRRHNAQSPLGIYRKKLSPCNVNTKNVKIQICWYNLPNTHLSNYVTMYYTPPSLLPA